MASPSPSPCKMSEQAFEEMWAEEARIVAELGDHTDMMSVTGSSSGDSPSSGGKDVKKPCIICGNIYENMPEHSPFCYGHKRLVESMVTHFKRVDKQEGTESAKEFATIRRLHSKHPPPTPLSKKVLEFEITNPSLGRGKKRIAQDFMETGEVTSAGAVVNRGLRLVPMHEAQWMRYAEDTLVIPRLEAKERWDDQLANTAEEAKDNLGPRASPLRIPMPFQDYIDASNFSSQQNEIRRCSKRLKASDDNMFNAKEDLKE